MRVAAVPGRPGARWGAIPIPGDDAVMTTDVDYDQIVRDSIEQLRKKFPERSEAELRTVVEEELATLRDATVQDYLSVLTVRAARKRMKAQGRAD